MHGIIFYADPRKPVIEINKTSQEIPVGDGSPVIINVSDNVTAALNTTITIRCPVGGIPTPAVTWEKDGVLIVEGGRFTFMPSNYSLVIRGAIVADIAKYTCRVQNFFGTHELSSTVTLIGNEGCILCAITEWSLNIVFMEPKFYIWVRHLRDGMA